MNARAGDEGALALGHAIHQMWPVRSGHKLLCECGEIFWARGELAVVDKYNAHVQEEIANREGGA